MLEENGEIGFGDFAGRHQRDLSRRLCRKAMETSERDTLHEDNGKSRVEDFAEKQWRDQRGILCRKAMERSERDTLHEDNGKSRVEDFAGKKKLEEFLGQNNIKTYS